MVNLENVGFKLLVDVGKLIPFLRILSNKTHHSQRIWCYGSIFGWEHFRLLQRKQFICDVPYITMLGKVKINPHLLGFLENGVGLWLENNLPYRWNRTINMNRFGYFSLWGEWKWQKMFDLKSERSWYFGKVGYVKLDWYYLVLIGTVHYR